MHRAGLDSLPNENSDLGIPYKWAQELCGIDILPSSPEVVINISQKNLESTLKKIKNRFQNRLSLAREIYNLETGYSITHKKISSTLTSFLTITLQEFSKIPTAQQIIKENIVDNSFMFYKAILSLNPTKFIAYIAVSPNYPQEYPLILIEFIHKTNHNSLNLNGLRDLEKEINVFPDDPPEEIKDENCVLLRQIRKLFYSIEIFARIEISKETNVQATYFRDTQGRTRSHPYKYISSGGGIYIQR